MELLHIFSTDNKYFVITVLKAIIFYSYNTYYYKNRWSGKILKYQTFIIQNVVRN